MTTIIAWSVLALLMCIHCVTLRADQLALNSREVCDKAAEALPTGSILISYCSRCDDEVVEIGQVKKTVIVCEGQDDYQLSVFCRKLYRSTSPVAQGSFSDSVRYEELSAADLGCEELYTVDEVDLAYVYVWTGEFSYQCLGKKLGLKCDVLVDIITLPEDVATRVQSLSRTATR